MKEAASWLIAIAVIVVARAIRTELRGTRRIERALSMLALMAAQMAAFALLDRCL